MHLIKGVDHGLRRVVVDGCHDPDVEDNDGQQEDIEVRVGDQGVHLLAHAARQVTLLRGLQPGQGCRVWQVLGLRLLISDGFRGLWRGEGRALEGRGEGFGGEKGGRQINNNTG